MDYKLAKFTGALGKLLLEKKYQLAVAESCTGGWLSKVITDVRGSSEWFNYGFVVYSDQAKHKLLGVSPELIATYGAVSAETVIAMAQGAVAKSGSDLAIAISGIAGPDGGTPDNPLGTVWFGWAFPDGSTKAKRKLFPGHRSVVRYHAVRIALIITTNMLQKYQ
ncbi:hypothetical protein TI04_04295 [Achromatium sp. WMS2]|nr:hypothetical protein TI04_04295 [Achromatium sp. WMS2]